MSRSILGSLALVLVLCACGQQADRSDAAAQQTLHYRDEQHGFSLAFNEHWTGYAVEQPGCFLMAADEETNETHPCLVITLPTNDQAWNASYPSAKGRFDALYIGVYTSDEWRRTQKEVTNGVRKFATKVITFDVPAQHPSDVDLRDLKIPDVIDSLESWAAK